MTVFSYTGALQTYTVPANVYRVRISAYGSQGGFVGQPVSTSLYGGLGGFAQGDLDVSPGQVLNVYVGGITYNGGGSKIGGGGGGGAYSDGGGASDVRVGGTALANRVIVAGGGGGSGYTYAYRGGDGGGLTGTAGKPGGLGGIPGVGGTQSSGNALGVGANGGDTTGGAGGGGYWGGTGGANYAGGGGGSGYIGGVLNGTMSTGVRTGLGEVTIVPTNYGPNAPSIITPTGSTRIDLAVTQRFRWTFSDPDAGDSQSAFSLRYRPSAGGAWTVITGVTPNNFYDFPASTLTAGDWEWQVATRDASGAPVLDANLVYSASSFFTAAVIPDVPSITGPVNGSTISTSSADLTWSTPSQQSYQIRKLADLAGSPDPLNVLYDSGEVVAAVARSATLNFPVNGRTEHLQVRIKDGGLWSAWASVMVDVAYTPPAVPTLVVSVHKVNGRDAALAVTVTNP